MLTRLPLLLCAGILVFPSSDAAAVPPRGPLEMSVAFVVNPLEGAASERCETSVAIKGIGKKYWWFAGSAAQSEPRCGPGRLEDRPSYSKGSLLMAEVSMGAWLSPGTLTVERLANVTLSFSVHNRSVQEKQELGVDPTSVRERKILITEGQVLFVPLWVTDDPDKTALGIHELFLKIALKRAEDASVTPYGVLAVRSGAEAGAVYLDGGALGQISSDSETNFPNLRTGLREIVLRLASGQEIRRVVRIQADRTVRANFSAEETARQHGDYELVPLGQNAQGYEEYRRSRDEAVVVKIPAGKYMMGNKETERSPLEHEVYVSSFLMDKLGVTWAQYKKHVEATGQAMPPRDPYWGMPEDHPAVFVTWDEAKGYCEWAGGRLPTEAEREKAARGTDRRKYPWGNEEPDAKRGVFRRAWGFDATSAVGTHPAGLSPYGLHDMGGNVWEWCSDWYDNDYFAVSPVRDPKGPASGIAHVLRGGSWDSRPDVLSASCRNWGSQGYREGDFGFRCVMNALPD